MASTTQVFYWVGPGMNRDGRQYYQNFCLNQQHYSIGDCVFLFPEHESSPHYVGRIKAAFVDESAGQADPHCIEIKWYERRTNLETNTRGIEESEREVFELEETDVNPIGCISGKCHIIKARTFDEAYRATRGLTETWFFCRGYFLQASNSFQPYTDAELVEHNTPMMAMPMGRAGSAMMPEAGYQHDGLSELEDGRSHYRQPSTKRKATGRVCAECGATSTPQWREGPLGPKTLCNACGVRHVRAQQRANKRAAGGAGGGKGRGAAHHAQHEMHHAPAAPMPPPHPGRYHQSPRPPKQPKAEKHVQEEAPMPAKHESNRPVRQAALAAASRTAAFARTGEFPNEEAPAGGMGGKRHRSGAGSHDSSLSAGGSGGDDPDELYDSAGAGGARSHPRSNGQVGSAHVPARANGGTANTTEASAAVNLLALSSIASGEIKMERTGSPRSAAAAAAPNPFSSPGKAGGALLGGGPDLASVLAAGVPLGVSPAKLAIGSSPRVGACQANTTAFGVGMGGMGASTSAPSNLAPGASSAAPAAAAAGGDAAAQGGAGTSGAPPSISAFDPSSLVSRINTRPPGSPADQMGGASGLGTATAGLSPLGLTTAGQPDLTVQPLLRVPSPTPLGGTSTAASSLLGGGTPALNAAHMAILQNQGEFHAMAMRAVKYFPELAQYSDLFSELDNLSGELPADTLRRLHEVREKVDSASKDAAAADAAVQAVTQVMQDRQKAAERAKEAATKAGEKLKEYLTGLINAHAVPASSDAAAPGGGAAVLPPPAPLQLGGTVAAAPTAGQLDGKAEPDAPQQPAAEGAPVAAAAEQGPSDVLAPVDGSAPGAAV